MSGLHWPGLLSWSTKYHDGTAPSKFTQMSKEDRDFITNALEAAMEGVEDLNKTLQDGLTQLASSGEDSALALVALEVVDRCVDDPDCARNLEKFNGTKILLSCAVGLSRDGSRFVQHPEVVSKSCEILSLMLANNDTLQEAAVEKHKALDYLVLENKDESNVNPVQFRAILSLLASIVRGHVKLEEIFLASPYNGMEWLCRPFAKDFFDQKTSKPEDVRRAREKTAMFVRHLLLEKAERVSAELMTKFILPAYQELVEAGEKDSENFFTVQYTESLADAGAIICMGNRGEEGEVLELVRTRMEIVIRKNDHELYEVEMEGLKKMLATAMAKI